MNNPSGKILTTFSLVMINVIAVDNLRSLPVAATFGFSLIFFYAAAALLFFIPSILMTAELATAWPISGGVYIWVREAFGRKVGFYCIWLQWIYNVIWYPTIFIFIGGIIVYLIDPNLVNNKIYMLMTVLSLYWAVTIVNCVGLKFSNIISTLGAIIGTILPMLLIALLGIIWVFIGKPVQITMTWKNSLPNFSNLENIAFLTTLIFGLMGMEMSAVHAYEVVNPKKNYPRALFYSAGIILITLIIASLAIAIVVPTKQLSLVSGLMDAFKIFFNGYNLTWALPIVAVMIIVGSMSGAAAWMIGPARGLLVASKDLQLPKILLSMNKKDMPVGILIAQGLIVTFLCCGFLLMPTVGNTYWVLSNLTSQLALIYYILFFSAGIRLRYKCKNTKRTFKIPGGIYGIWLIGLLGISVCLVTIVIGFIPPTQIAAEKVIMYEATLITGMLIFCLPALFIKHSK